MPARDYAMLQEFYQLEPFGPTRDNLHSAQLASLTASAHFRGRHTPDKFMWQPPPSESDRAAAFAAALESLASKTEH